MRPLLASVPMLLAGLAAQDLTPKAPPQSRPIAIEGATVHTVAGATLTEATIWFEQGVIRGVGSAGAPVPADAQRIDGKGKHVYPGMFASCTQLGLIEIDLVRATNDRAETGNLTPEVRAGVAVNPDSAVIPVTRSNGVLAAAVFPQGGLVPGRVSVIQLEGWTSEELTVLGDAGVVVNWPAIPRLDHLKDVKPEVKKELLERGQKERARIAELFEQARAYFARRAQDPTQSTDVRFEGLAPVLEGKVPVFVCADALEPIESGLAWCKRARLRPILVGGGEAHLCLELLKARDVPVIVTGVFRLPRRDDSPVDEIYALPRVLQEAGIRFCLAGGQDFYNERNLPYEAATAIGHGLDPAVALRAITLSAAEILGVEKRLGSLEVGKDATLIVTDGDPLELPTKTLRAFVAGRDVDLSNKQTELAKKYRERYRQLGTPKEAGSKR